MTPRDLKNSDDLNSQTLLDNSPKYVSVFTLFCLIHRHFWLSSEALIKLFFPYFIYFTWNEYISTHSYICVYYNVE